MSTHSPVILEDVLSHAPDVTRPLDFVAGQFVPSLTDTTADVLNPATGQAFGITPTGSRAGVDRAVAAAKEAFQSWRLTTPKYRADLLFELARRIEESADLLTRMEMLDVGKPRSVAAADLPMAADSIRFLAGAARTATAPAPGQYVDGHYSWLQREPLGVIGSIAPWNYPFQSAVWKLAPALAAGNTVVIKPSELTPLTTLMLAELTRDLLPSGVVNVVPGTGSVVGGALCEHPDVAMVSLTGSVQSGRLVAAAAGRNLKRVHLELGGNAPVIVYADADLEAAADAVKLAGYWNSGQECGAASRVLVAASVEGDFVELLAERAKSLSVGDPAEGPDIEIGPLISRGQLERVDGMVTAAVSGGAVVAAGGQAMNRPGFFFEPTVLTGLRQSSPAIQQEIFGPVVTVQPFDSPRAALGLANDVEYGLAASVWTQDISRAMECIRDLNFGTVWVNDHLVTASEMPWVGFGTSGIGHDMSTKVLDDYTRNKHAMVAYLPLPG